MKIEIKDIINNVGGFGTGETVLMTIDGTEVRFEAWTSGNGSGADFYLNDGNPWVPDEENEEAVESLTEYLETLLEDYYETYQLLVNPALETTVRLTLAKSEDIAEQFENLSVSY